MKKPRQFRRVAELIRTSRARKGLSQTDLSRTIGYRNGQFISNVERAMCSIPSSKINVLSEILDVHVDLFTTAMVEDYKETIEAAVTKKDVQ